MKKLSQGQLLEKVLEGMRAAGWTPVVLEKGKPALVRAMHVGKNPIDLRIYLWNCTHGGKGRAENEFRVQFATQPRSHQEEKVLLLGWHQECEVFAAWDIAAHDDRVSESPSAQVKKETLEQARANSFAVQRKDNEIVVAFRQEFILDYASSIQSLHSGVGLADILLLNDLEHLNMAQVNAVKNQTRRKVIKTIVSHYRDRSFAAKVMSAYGYRCAFCGVQLGLLDAAHIVPVQLPESTDEISNGVALCKLHHAAFDANLVSFDTKYTIQVSKSKTAELTARNLVGGFDAFRKGLKAKISLPPDTSERPDPRYIRLARKVRAWVQ